MTEEETKKIEKFIQENSYGSLYYRLSSLFDIYEELTSLSNHCSQDKKPMILPLYRAEKEIEAALLYLIYQV